jgi:heme-degrading monooxygenase HmoA
LLNKEINVQAAAIFVSRHQRRVATFVWLTGHDAYAKLRNAWDEYHLQREHREAVEKRDLSLCRVTAVAGDSTISPGAHTVLAIERLDLSASQAAELLNVIVKLRPAGFVGAALLGTDDGFRSYLVHWWDHKESLAEFRESDAAKRVVGAVGQTGDPYELYELIRTFRGKPRIPAH